MTKSIAEYKIFNCEADFHRMKDILGYYQVEERPVSFSYLDRISRETATILRNNDMSNSSERLVDVIAYCLMPTHLHLALHQLRCGGISKFMNKVLNSYSRYFNLKYKRKGPLWQGRFKKIQVESNEQLLHLTRYIHLNPVTAYLVDLPEAWHASSYMEFIQTKPIENLLCSHHNFIEMDCGAYKRFVEERIPDQRELASIKYLSFGEPI